MSSVRRHRKNASAMRLLGRQLARFREAAGLTQRDLAAEFNLAEETVASIEQGRRPLKPDLADRLDARLDTKGALSVAVENMPEVDLIPAWAEEFLDREQEALALASYENQVVPGLLQTADYARAVFASRIPVMDKDEIEAQTERRLARRRILQSTPRRSVSFVLWEAVLHVPLGGTHVHRAQLAHLRSLTELPGLAIQVMPFTHTTHPALDGAFVLLETPDHQHLAYTETQRGSHLIHAPDEVSILAQRYAMLRTLALDPDDTRGLLDRLLGET